MATKKSKSSNKSNKTKSTKSKTANEPIKEAELKAETTSVTEEIEEVEEATVVKSSTSISSSKDKKPTHKKGFFSRKYEEKESILTVFKTRKFWGALLGELIGTMLLALLFFSLPIIDSSL